MKKMKKDLVVCGDGAVLEWVLDGVDVEVEGAL